MKFVFKNLLIRGKEIERVEVKGDNFKEALHNVTLYIITNK